VAVVVGAAVLVLPPQAAKTKAHTITAAVAASDRATKLLFISVLSRTLAPNRSMGA
jgi:hypothetical protein